MSRFLFAAVLCGATPLVVGTGIFVAWLLLRWHSLKDAGITTIMAGTVAFAVGCLCLMIHVAESRRNKRVSPRRMDWKSMGTIALLVINFPIAAAYVAAAIHIETRYSVTVINESPGRIEAFRVVGCGVDVDFGTIESQSRVCRSFNIRHDDYLNFRAILEDSEISGTVDYYMTHVRGADKTIILKPDNSFVVLDRART
jgi:hypothetical protein